MKRRRVGVACLVLATGLAAAAPAAPSADSAETPAGSTAAAERATPFSADEGFEGLGPAEPAGLFRVTAGLLFTIALVFIVAAVLKRTPAGRSVSGLKLESRLAVGRGSALAVVHAEGRRLLVGITPNQISYMTDLPEGSGGRDKPSERTGAAGTFDRIYSAVISRAGGSR